MSKSNGFDKFKKYNRIHIDKQQETNKKVMEYLKTTYKDYSFQELEEESVGVKSNIRELKNDIHSYSTVVLGIIAIIISLYKLLIGDKENTIIINRIKGFMLVTIFIIILIFMVDVYRKYKRKSFYEILDTVLDYLIREKDKETRKENIKKSRYNKSNKLNRDINKKHI